jgi:hypothetical protein
LKSDGVDDCCNIVNILKTTAWDSGVSVNPALGMLRQEVYV